MKDILFALAAFVAAAPAFCADVGALGGVGDPDYHGQIDIRKTPKPNLLNPDPVLVRHGNATGEPVYLHVPPDQAKDWANHCQTYNACDQKVFFVEDKWYKNVYLPAQRKKRETDKP